MKPGLNSLFGASNSEKFMGDHWPHSPFVLHGLDFKFAREIKALSSLDSLLAIWQGSVQAHLPDVNDEASSIDSSVSDAKKLFANRMGLLFNNVETTLTDLKPWIEAIKSDLGLPQMTYGRCIAYATPNGKGTAAHFDQNINFVLQLSGTKVWKLTPNFKVINPTVRHTLGLPMDPELASYTEPFSNSGESEMPKDDALTITLKPGSLLFVPRGYWHSTLAEGEALALNFTFNQPNWADLLTVALRSRLILSPEWRELADGVSSQSSARREQADSRFNELLIELIADLPNWQAADILGATEGR